MSFEEEAQKNLIQRFPYLEGKIRTPRAKRVFLEVAKDQFKEVFDYAVKEQQFNFLCSLIGLDAGEMIGLIYVLAHPKGTTLNIQTGIPKNNPVFNSITPIFPAAEVYERELVDLLGAKIEGLPSGSRYPLTDDWPIDQFPLRKDWKSDTTEIKEES